MLNEKAVEKARTSATAIAATLKSGDFSTRPPRPGPRGQDDRSHRAGAPIGDIGGRPKLEEAAFGLKEGAVSDAVVTENGAAVVKVVERKEATSEDAAKDKDTLRTELLNDRKQKFFAAYMTKARQRMNIRTNPQTIAQVTG